MTTTRPIEEMTHEEIAREAIALGRRTGNTDLLSLGKDLLTAVENEQDSQPIVDAISAEMSK